MINEKELSTLAEKEFPMYYSGFTHEQVGIEKSIRDRREGFKKGYKAVPFNDTEDHLKILQDMLEMAIKMGRRIYHDACHMMSDIPNDNRFKDDYQKRLKHYEVIFYPDDGMKNYRIKIFREMERLEQEIERKNKLLIEHGIDPNPDQPF